MQRTTASLIAILLYKGIFLSCASSLPLQHSESLSSVDVVYQPGSSTQCTENVTQSKVSLQCPDKSERIHIVTVLAGMDATVRSGTACPPTFAEKVCEDNLSREVSLMCEGEIASCSFHLENLTFSDNVIPKSRVSSSSCSSGIGPTIDPNFLTVHFQCIKSDSVIDLCPSTETFTSVAAGQPSLLALQQFLNGEDLPSNWTCNCNAVADTEIQFKVTVLYINVDRKEDGVCEFDWILVNSSDGADVGQKMCGLTLNKQQLLTTSLLSVEFVTDWMNEHLMRNFGTWLVIEASIEYNVSCNMEIRVDNSYYYDDYEAGVYDYFNSTLEEIYERLESQSVIPTIEEINDDEISDSTTTRHLMSTPPIEPASDLISTNRVHFPFEITPTNSDSDGAATLVVTLIVGITLCTTLVTAVLVMYFQRKGRSPLSEQPVHTEDVWRVDINIDRTQQWVNSNTTSNQILMDSGISSFNSGGKEFHQSSLTHMHENPAFTEDEHNSVDEADIGSCNFSTETWDGSFS